jgi:ABC-type glycerol-3-phosphate transport system substrate-binding protein
MQTSNFQIIVLGVCTTLILVGIGVFATFGGFLGGKSIGKVTLWGTLDAEAMHTLFQTLNETDHTFQNVTYVQKKSATYESDLINAMANGTAPDLFLLDDEDLNEFSDKILPIPYSYVSQSAFFSSYIDEGRIFLVPQGALALPFMVDPLVMYWNRDLFAGAGLASAPAYWNDFLTLSPKITSLTTNATVKKSAVALGQWQNIDHAKQILSTLFMQAGDPIVSRASDGSASVVFGDTPAGYPTNPAESALRFYTEFANPSKTSYSWNKALPQASRAFASGDLAVYFGLASESSNIAALNPNLHFSVSVMPQIEGGGVRITYGKLTGLAIPRVAQNAQGAATVAQKLTSKEASAALSAVLMLPSSRRDVPANTQANASADVFLQSALISRTWIDPGPKASDPLFKDMIESVVSGKSKPSEAVHDAEQLLLRLFK